jgi:hypothetical protein
MEDIPIEQNLPQTVFDENLQRKDNDRLPILEPLKVLRYKTIKKNNSLGWWSAVVLLEDHAKKQVCFYRWRKRNKEWKRDKKIVFRTRSEWSAVKETIDNFINALE